MNILKSILASFFSVLLVVALIIAPLGSFATSLFEEENIDTFIDSLGIREDLADEISIDGKTNKEFAAMLKKSNFYNELFDLCTDYMTAPLYNKTVNLSEKDIKKITSENLDELLEMIQASLPEFETDLAETEGYFAIDETKLKEKISEALDEITPDLVKNIKEIRKESNIEEFAKIITAIRSVYYFVLGAIIVLTILIIVLKLKKLNGCIWLGIDYAIASIFTFILSGLISSVLANVLAEMQTGEYISNIKNFITETFDKIYGNNLMWYIIMAVIFLVVGISYKIFRSAKGGTSQANSASMTTDQMPTTPSDNQ